MRKIIVKRHITTAQALGQNFRCAPILLGAAGVSVTSETCHNLQDESSCWERRSLSPVWSLARRAESDISEYFSA